MALQNSGAISLADIAGEFGGSQPHSISEYYGADTGVPSSGTIDFADFYGTSSTPANLQAIYSFSTADTFSSVGISWFMRQKGLGNGPSIGGHLNLTGSGTYACIYGGTESNADYWIGVLNSYPYFAVDGSYTGPSSGWSKIEMVAADRAGEWIVYYPTNIGSLDQGIRYIDGVNAGNNDARLDWYYA